MAGVHVHQTAGHVPTKNGRKTEIQVGGARYQGRNFRRQDIQKGDERRTDAISQRSSEGFKGKYKLHFFFFPNTIFKYCYGPSSNGRCTILHPNRKSRAANFLILSLTRPLSLCLIEPKS